MGITNISRDWGVEPAIVRISTTDTIEAVQVTGYLFTQADNIDQINKGAFEWSVSDSVLVYASNGSGLFAVSSDFGSLLPEEGGGGGDEFLRKDQNLADVNNKETSTENLGFGSGDIITITDADFTAGVYQLPNPCPNRVTVQCLTPGNTVRLPIANQLTSFIRSQGPVITIPGSLSIAYQSIDVADQSGSIVDGLSQPSAVHFQLLTALDANGTWLSVPQVESWNFQSGNIFAFGSLNTIYTAPDGNDDTGLGTSTQPFQTLSRALDAVAGASSSNLFQIYMFTGVYTDVNIVLLPFVSIEGNGSKLTVSGSVTADSSFLTQGGTVYIQNFSSLVLPATVTLDFTGAGSPQSVNINLLHARTDSATTLSIIGDTNIAPVFVDSDLFGFSNELTYVLTNCLGAINGGATANVTISQTVEIGSNFTIANCTIIGNVVGSNSANSNDFVIFSEFNKIFGSTTYNVSGASNLNVQSKGNTYLAGITLDNGLGGGVVNFSSDTLTALPTLLNGATYTPTSIADAMAANTYFTPANYIPTAGPPGEWTANSVVGNLAGIDAAIAGATGIPPAYGEMYFQGNVTLTTIAAANTPVKVDATYNSGVLSGFSQLSGTLTYTDAPLRTVVVSADLTATYAATSQNTSFYIALNGVVVAKSQQSTFIGAITPANQSNPCKAMLDIVNGDTLEIWVENNDNANDIIVTDLNFTVQSIAGFDSGSLFLAGENYLSLSGNTLTANPVNLGTSNTNGKAPYAKIQDVSASNRLLGRSTLGAGVIEEIFVGTGLTLSGGTISVDTTLINVDVTLIGLLPSELSDYIASGGTFISMMQTVQGIRTFLGNSVQIGESIELVATGLTAGTVAGSTGTVRVVFGPITIDSPLISSSVFGAGSERNWSLTFKITRVSSTEICISAAGWYDDSSHNVKSLRLIHTPGVDTFDWTVNNDIDIQYNMTVAAGTFYFYAQNVTVSKYTV